MRKLTLNTIHVPHPEQSYAELSAYHNNPGNSLGISPCRGTQASAYIVFLLYTESSRWRIVRLETQLYLVIPSSPTILPTGEFTY